MKAVMAAELDLKVKKQEKNGYLRKIKESNAVAFLRQ